MSGVTRPSTVSFNSPASVSLLQDEPSKKIGSDTVNNLVKQFVEMTSDAREFKQITSESFVAVKILAEEGDKLVESMKADTAPEQVEATKTQLQKILKKLGRLANERLSIEDNQETNSAPSSQSASVLPNSLS